jgi:hypothetical protein
LGVSEIVAEVTVNCAEAESPDGVPVTTTVYTPAMAALLTLKEPDTEPLAENVHVAAVKMDDGILETQA